MYKIFGLFIPIMYICVYGCVREYFWSFLSNWNIYLHTS